MKRFFARNLNRNGRLVRAMAAALLFVGAGILWKTSGWLAVALFAGALFTAAEALAGWCVLRACGIKTKL